MNKALLIILLTASLLIISVISMMVLRVCPPQGPWPMPPWCGPSQLIPGQEAIIHFWLTIPYNISVNSLSIVHDGIIKNMNSASDLSYETSINATTGEVINYYYRLNNFNSTSNKLEVIKLDQEVYDYITTGFNPDLPKDFIFGVNMFDTWGGNYNFLMFENTRDHIKDSLKRVAATGSSEVYVHDFLMTNKTGINHTNYEFINEVFTNDYRDESMTQEDMNNLAQEAVNNELSIGWRLNLHFIDIGEFIGSSDITGGLQEVFNEFNQPKTEAWVRHFFQEYNQTLIQKAGMLNQAGFNYMVITPNFMNPRFHPHESLANELWKDLINNLKQVFNGEVGIIVDRYGFLEGNNGDEDWTQYDYYETADRVYYNIYNLIAEYEVDSVTGSNLEDSFNDLLNELEARATEHDINLTLMATFYSYERAINELPVEFNDVNNPAIKSLKRDWKEQALVYESLLQAVEGRELINGLVMNSYWWDNAMYPDSANTRIDISPSTRNKPAEAVFQKWAYSN
ncbi:hypothetical protein GF352_00900 [archaeon]|nr:hypothetical protein [archaeon]